MAKALLNVILNLMGTLIQIVTYIPNQIIKSTLPDISDKVVEVMNNISSIFESMTFALSFIPPYILGILIFIVTIEIAKHTIKISTHTLIKVWTLFQKVKFW